MTQNTYVQTLIGAQVDGAAVANTTTATSLLPAAAKFLIPPQSLQIIGQKLRVKAAGRISTLVTSPGTLTLDLRLGSAVQLTSGAMALNVAAQTNTTWRLEAILDLRSVGATAAATMLGVGDWECRAVIGSAAAGAGGIGTLTLPDTAPVIGTGFDSTVSNIFDFFATWSVANAANSIQLHQFSLEAMN